MSASKDDSVIITAPPRRTRFALRTADYTDNTDWDTPAPAPPRRDLVGLPPSAEVDDDKEKAS